MAQMTSVVHLRSVNAKSWLYSVCESASPPEQHTVCQEIRIPIKKHHYQSSKITLR